MLVLTRKINETVLLPDLDIEIQILKIRGGSVAIGISAPRHVKILRGELCEEDDGEIEMSTRSSKPQLKKTQLATL